MTIKTKKPVHYLKNLSGEELRRRLHYDPETGIFTWIDCKRPDKNGKQAGTINTSGYIQISFVGKLYLAARLVFLYMTDSWPTQEVDHKNRDKLDNRWINLSEASDSIQMHNRNKFGKNRSLPVGVCFVKSLYIAQIQKDKKHYYLGSYQTPFEAEAAYLMKKEELYGH